MPADSQPRRACDRCHNIKERCQWSPDSDVCQRCLRLGHDCQTLRPVQRLGRKPRSQALRTLPLHGAPQPPLGYGDAPLDARSFTERSDSASHASHASPAESADSPRTRDLTKAFADMTGLSDAERELCSVCFAKSDAAGQFTLGPSFHFTHRADLTYRLSSAVPELKDAFVACAVIMARHQNLAVSQKAVELCARKAAVGIASLRMLQVRKREDVSVCLVLGMVIVTYSLFMATGEGRAICASALTHVRPWYRSPNVHFEIDEYAYLICLMYTEMIECILESDVPTLRYGDFGKHVTWVDRYMGLSPPVLTFFYDLCQLGNSLRNTRNTEDEATQRRMHEIESSIKRWMPLTPAGFPDRYTHIEVLQIMTQIKSLRQAALLVLHRLRFPYGVQDEKGLALSDSILLECGLAMQHIPGVPMGMDIAFVIACFEPKEEWHQQETLTQVADYLKFSDAFHEKIRAMLQQIWRAKIVRRDIYWFDIPSFLS
ncbi:uncharacterized protein HMPREF1541_09180 [Cyphellophora europaea CBS 101466]|uniref:Zn(2)-C6 fungal-type domain-containing protein n=1 Tax=Cyphellophora europaea (strain CBS 101466) TaxID=1220924 RepID=W2SBP6_CYPE1|nr:uncharacterized protein HMPREF1541_09180 [Cyphellophora europaea CBS 101466]ETN45349.1 hypothetical protein HMPREF1541_09180 [Cyphellophora europaea CBS 101466]